MRTMNTKRGDKMAFVTLDDRSGRIEMAIFSDTFQRYRDLLSKDKLVVVEGEVSVDDYSGGYKMSARSIYDMDQAREHFAHRVLVDVDEVQAANGFINNLKSVLSPYREGICNVELRYHRTGATAEISLGQEWRIHPTDECLHRLREMAGAERVRIDY